MSGQVQQVLTYRGNTTDLTQSYGASLGGLQSTGLSGGLRTAAPFMVRGAVTARLAPGRQWYELSGLTLYRSSSVPQPVCTAARLYRSSSVPQLVCTAARLYRSPSVPQLVWPGRRRQPQRTLRLRQRASRQCWPGWRMTRPAPARWCA
ncbi:hypothetical protein [Deinococcus sp.]|uniref:hypothetical protein n=1 Tax=Deinococcus sp. TaxID=47478 RepID=UPI0025CEE434|nr:hypothetical protein [Deinococcus sp.]